MAADNGPGLLGQNLTPGIADAVLAQAAALRVEYDSLKDYKVLVDDLLVSLEKSPADHGKLADGTLPQSALGTADFTQAGTLHKSYNTVHSELQKLSKGLAGQIEALGIAIMSAGKGYDGVDEETKRRMLAIAKEAREQYVPERDPYAKKPDTTPNAPSVNGTKKGGVV
ncbi:hypothetical protein [Streptomyces sp. cmx-4-9]|uniref:hypothetical protein n=1 Tax=Streptomyces sp. cmx-4-9 TaxID=2790941 RepID=UPI0039813DBD